MTATALHAELLAMFRAELKLPVRDLAYHAHLHHKGVVKGDGSGPYHWPDLVDKACDVRCIAWDWQQLGFTLTEALDGHPHRELALAAEAFIRLDMTEPLKAELWARALEVTTCPPGDEEMVDA
jgi:hypothetical protein